MPPKTSTIDDGDSQLFDLAQLTEALDLFAEGIHNILNKLENNAEQTFAAMDQAVNESNSKLLKDAAHKFKGSLATLGWSAAAGVAFELETLGRKGEFSGAAKLIDTLRETYQVSHTRLLQIVSNDSHIPRD